jgi:hypothetical protein
MNDDLIEKATAKLAIAYCRLRGCARRRWAVVPPDAGAAASSAELDRASYVDKDPQKLKGLAWLLFNLDEFIFVK